MAVITRQLVEFFYIRPTILLLIGCRDVASICFGSPHFAEIGQNRCGAIFRVFRYVGSPAAWIIERLFRRRVLCGRYRCAKLGWKRYINFNNVDILRLPFEDVYTFNKTKLIFAEKKSIIWSLIVDFITTQVQSCTLCSKTSTFLYFFE